VVEGVGVVDTLCEKDTEGVEVPLPDTQGVAQWGKGRGTG